jgi:CubicO group peptidase (beta-lactamase class C family)
MGQDPGLVGQVTGVNRVAGPALMSGAPAFPAQARVTLANWQHPPQPMGLPGNPMADGGICATLRDLARFGQLFLQRGRVVGRVIVPEAWIDDTIRGPSGPAGRPALSEVS